MRNRGNGGVVVCPMPCTSSTSQLTTLLILVAIILSSSSSPSSSSNVSDDGSQQQEVVQWLILTKQNFSSQIRLHPHLLLFVTLPWSGEARSLMKEISQVVNYRQDKFAQLKLMLLYKTTERMLADSLGASEWITVLHYRKSTSYKYKGKLQAQNILSSAHFLMSRLPEEIPLKFLNTPEDLNVFLKSTDKALLLLEFCGWTPRLLAKGKKNGTKSAFEGLFGADPDGETNITLAAEGKKDLKGNENEKMKCAIKSGFNGIPWIGEFSSANDSAFLESENLKSSVGFSCSFEEFKRFESFFWNFTMVVREFYLPPERLRFGVVAERSLLSYLGDGGSGSWLMMLYFANCPSCSKVVGDGNDLRSVLQMHNPLVVELEGDGHDLEPYLPANKPSVLLFIDRSSDSLKTRTKSKEALNAFRDLALHYQMTGQNYAKPLKSSVEVSQASMITTGHRRPEPSRSQVKPLKDKMSVVIINDGKRVRLDNIASGLQGSSLQEILAYALQQQKEIKFSSLAKDVGFQLLSDDFDIKIAEALPPQPEVFQSKPTDGEAPQHIDEKISYLDTTTQLSIDSGQYNSDPVLVSANERKVKTTSLQLEKSEEQHFHSNGFKGSFFFSDGGYRLLKALTGRSTIPSVVIIEPVSQQHYVLSEESIVSYSSVSDFLGEFLNGSLVPHQRSESLVTSNRDAPSPPFVNMDFHELDFIPRVSTHTFSDMVLGINQSDTTNAGHVWKKDVLVLFSNSWCGFCQRMELVVREVYRALKGYSNMLKNGCRSKKAMPISYNLEDDTLKLPLIYFMDCTVNDCSFILRSMAQRELYPTLLLFPAERKNAVFYKGNMAVSDIFKFIADHGSNSHSLVGDNGILWTAVEQETVNQKSYKDTLETAVHEEARLARDQYHAVLKNRTPKVAVRYDRITPSSPNGPQEKSPQLVGGSILHSTDKLLNVHLFDKSTILIVNADRGRGFQGLIINKQISWDSLREFEEGFEELKEAPLSFGGPFVKRGIPLVALSKRLCVKDQYPEVLPNVYFLDQEATAHEIKGLKLGNQSIRDYWFFLGYSSWGWDQLFEEIAGGAWTITDGSIVDLNWPLR